MKDFNFADTYLYKLHLLTNNLDKILDQTLSSRCEITLSQFILLLSVLQKGPINQRKIAKFLMLSPAAVSRQVEVVKKKGWLVVEASESDRRDRILRITPAGSKVVEAGHDSLERHVFEIFNGQDNHVSLMQHIDALLAGIEGVSRKHSNDRLKVIWKELENERRKANQHTKSKATI